MHTRCVPESIKAYHVLLFLWWVSCVEMFYSCIDLHRFLSSSFLARQKQHFSFSIFCCTLLTTSKEKACKPSRSRSAKCVWLWRSHAAAGPCVIIGKLHAKCVTCVWLVNIRTISIRWVSDACQMRTKCVSDAYQMRIKCVSDPYQIRNRSVQDAYEIISES